MRPVLVLVVSQSKRDALTNAKAISGLFDLDLKPIHFNDELEYSYAQHLITAQHECYIEYYELDDSDTSRNELLDILVNLKRAFLKGSSGTPSFTSLAFAAALLYPAGKATTFLDVIACPHAAGEHIGFEDNNRLRKSIYEVMSLQNAELSYPTLAKSLALLLSK